LKILTLKGKARMAYIKKHIIKWISYVILGMCIVMFILALFSNVAHRLPMVSYFARELKLPYLLEIEGTVQCLIEGEEQRIPIRVSVGGYSVETISGQDYSMKFTAVEKEQIPVIVEWEIGNVKQKKLEYISFKDSYAIRFEPKYDLGE